MNNLRTDLTIGTAAKVHLENIHTEKYPNGNALHTKVKHTPTIINTLLNGYVDFIDLSMFKVFAGAGAGIAFIKEKITGNTIINSNRELILLPILV